MRKKDILKASGICALSILLMTGCGEKKKETKSNSNSDSNQVVESNSNSNDTSNNDSNVTSNSNSNVEKKDYSKFVGKWSNDNTQNEFTVEKITDKEITFSWFQYRLNNIEHITLPFKDGKAIFYFQGKHSLSNKEYKRKGTIELTDKGVNLIVEDVKSIDKNYKEIKDTELAGEYVPAGTYTHPLFNTNSTKERIDFSTYVGKWMNNKTQNWFEIEKITESEVKFTWFLYRLTGIDNETLPLSNDCKAIFYFEGEDLNDKPFKRKGTIEITAKGVNVIIEDVKSIDKNYKKLEIPAAEYITAGTYTHPTKEKK